MFKNYIILLTIGLIWGSQFIFQEMALINFHPIWIGTFRAVIGAITLILICKVIGIKGSSNQWVLFSVIGLLEASVPFVFLPWGQQNLTTSIAAILMGTIPFYALMFSPLFIKGAKVTGGNTISVVIGFSGLAVLFYPELSSNRGTINVVSSMLIVTAAVCFAIALLLLNQIRDEHPLIVARNVLSMASIQLVVIALFTAPLEFGPLSTSSTLALLYLGVMCAGIVYYLYMMCIKYAGVVFASMSNYLIPTIGVLIGALLAREVIAMTTWVALSMILCALFVNQVLSKNMQTG